MPSKVMNADIGGIVCSGVGFGKREPARCGLESWESSVTYRRVDESAAVLCAGLAATGARHQNAGAFIPPEQWR